MSTTFKYFTHSPSNLIQLYEDGEPYDGHRMYKSFNIGEMSFDEYLDYVKQNDSGVKWRDGKIINYSNIIENTLSGNIYEKINVNFITAMKIEYGAVTFQVLYKTLV
jgi:hypothetical protein